MAKKEEKNIVLKKIEPKMMNVIIEGDSDLVLNKMNDVVARELIDKRKGKAKDIEEPNYWEEVITSIHWRDGKPQEFSKESMQDALTNNAPCIKGFGFIKSFGEAVTRNEIDKYSTKLRATINILAPNDLIPITFDEWHLDEKLMQPQKGSPVLAKLNRFTGWRAVIPISFTDNVYSDEQLLSIINFAGFGIGIGSGRSSGYGRYHVIGVE